MNARREAFCRAYARCGVGTQAAREAGYSEKTAYSIAHQLLSKVEVSSRVEELKAEIREEKDRRYREVQEAIAAYSPKALAALINIINDEGAAASARASAALSLLDRAGHAKPEGAEGVTKIEIVGGLPPRRVE